MHWGRWCTDCGADIYTVEGIARSKSLRRQQSYTTTTRWNTCLSCLIFNQSTWLVPTSSRQPALQFYLPNQDIVIHMSSIGHFNVLQEHGNWYITRIHPGLRGPILFFPQPSPNPARIRYVLGSMYTRAWESQSPQDIILQLLDGDLDKFLQSRA